MSQAQKVSRQARRKAREMTLQALYQMLLSGGNVSAVEQQFIVANDMSKVDSGYFRDLLYGVARNVGSLDQALSPVLDRPFKQLDPVETAILRLGCFELMHRPDVPYRVVINEAIEMAKRFGAQESHKYINGILDKLAPRIRTVEVREYRHGKSSERKPSAKNPVVEKKVSPSES